MSKPKKKRTKKYTPGRRPTIPTWVYDLWGPLTEENKLVTEIVNWMRDYKTTRQMVRLLINDESFGSTKEQQ